VFDEFKQIQKRKAEEEKQKQEEEELAKKMEAIKLNEYKPKYGQDPQLFNEMFMNYIDHLHKAGENNKNEYLQSDRPYS
jgi:hypothetical protein